MEAETSQIFQNLSQNWLRYMAFHYLQGVLDSYPAQVLLTSLGPHLFLKAEWHLHRANDRNKIRKGKQLTKNNKENKNHIAYIFLL